MSLRRVTRDRAMTLWVVALSFALAFWQRPGWATSDTKIDLHVDPATFLSQVASAWTPTTSLGEVHSSQYAGYLWPMGPFFAALHSIGLGPWVVQRLWLGLMFALASWGVLKLLDVLFGRPRGVAHVVAAAFYVLNPYVVVFTTRASVILLGYAALPWLVLVTYHGVRTPRGWRDWRGWWWAAAFALILASTGGGVNAAVVGWMLVGPLVLAIYEAATRTVRWRDSLSFLVRVAILGLLASLWWIVPILVHVRFGIDFLPFTEQPSSIWATNSATEVLRLMGFWTSYIGVGYGVARPIFSDGGTLLFNVFVVGASLLIPAVAAAGFAWGRRIAYAPLLLALVVVSAVIMIAGFPDGTPLRHAMDWVYRKVFVLRFMRTTYKEGPVLALGLAGLLGLAAQQSLGRLRKLRGVRLRRAAPVGAAVLLAALIVLAALPLVQGDAIDTQLQWKRIPSAWTQAGQGLDRSLQPNTRALVLPGQIFAYYTWGGTVDAILPRLTKRPVAVRYETPYSDLHAADLLTTVDDMVQQRRLVPGQLPPLLKLMGVGAVVTGADDDTSRSGAIDPGAAAGVLSEQLGPAPAHSYGPARAVSPGGDVGAPPVLPEVRRYDTPGARGIVHVDPSGPATVLDGGAQGLADLAAFGGLPARNAIFYAGDLSPSALRTQAAQGADLVITDSNRRRAFLPESTQQNRGATMAATQPLATDSATINPFTSAGSDAQTVSVLQGARYIRAPEQAGVLQFPEHAPFAAFDGDPATSWVADRFLPISTRWIEIGFNAPRNVPYVDVYPLSDAHGIVTEVDVNGVRHAVGRGWTRIPVGLRQVKVVRVTIDNVVQPKVGLGGHGGFREIRIPGVHVRQQLRTPIVASRALAGSDLRRDELTFLFERTTGDDLFRRSRYGATTVLDKPQDRGDAEKFIDRIVVAPATRSYTARAWVYPSVDASDSALDRLAGASGAATFDSSGRFEDKPAYRASSAFDGRAAPGWIGVWAPPQAPLPWISWRTQRPLTISRLTLRAPGLPVRRPTVVTLAWSGGVSPPLTVGRDGSVVLPAPVRARAFRLTVLRAAFAPGTLALERQAAAVGIGSISVPGLRPQPVPRRGALRAGCGSIAILVAGRRVSLAPSGTIEQLDAGLPLRGHACTGPVTMPAGIQEIRALPGVLTVDLLQLRSRAPTPAPAAADGGRVVAPGKVGTSSLSGVRLALTGPSWIVLGESFDAGWRAVCNGRSLGAPRVIDGYANGWAAPAGCRQVEFSFAPQDGVQTSYVISALSCLALIAFLLLGRWLGPIFPRPHTVLRRLPNPIGRPLPFARAAVIALALAVPLGGIFAIRVGAASFPLLTLVLWRGVGAGALAGVAAALLGIAVPAVYLITSPTNQGGFNFTYSVKLIWAHWIGVFALVLLGLAGFRAIAVARSEHRRLEPGSPDDGLDEREEHPAGGVQQEVVPR